MRFCVATSDAIIYGLQSEIFRVCFFLFCYFTKKKHRIPGVIDWMHFWKAKEINFNDSLFINFLSRKKKLIELGRIEDCFVRELLQGGIGAFFQNLTLIACLVVNSFEIGCN